MSEYRPVTEGEFKQIQITDLDYAKGFLNYQQEQLEKYQRWVKRDIQLLEKLPQRIKNRQKTIEKIKAEIFQLEKKYTILENRKIEDVKTRVGGFHDLLPYLGGKS